MFRTGIFQSISIRIQFWFVNKFQKIAYSFFVKLSLMERRKSKTATIFSNFFYASTPNAIGIHIFKINRKNIRNKLFDISTVKTKDVQDDVNDRLPSLLTFNKFCILLFYLYCWTIKWKLGETFLIWLGSFNSAKKIRAKT